MQRQHQPGHGGSAKNPCGQPPATGQPEELHMPRNLPRRSLALALAGCVQTPFGALAAPELAKPAGSPILTVSGRIAVTNGDGGAEFDRAMLEAMRTNSFTTTTPWYERAVAFEGVLAADLMRAVGARGETVTAYALNDYATEIPITDFERFGVLLALKRDGAYMPVRDKGPIFLIYPFDNAPELKTRRYYSRCAWQLRRLVVG